MGAKVKEEEEFESLNSKRFKDTIFPPETNRVSTVFNGFPTMIFVLRLGILAYQEAANHPWLATSASGEPAVELDASIFDGLKAFSRNNDAWVCNLVIPQSSWK